MTDQRTDPRSAEIEALYTNQGRELWALFYAECSDPEAAHDALQEAFLRLQEHVGEPILDSRAWVLRVGRNWLRDMARRQRVAARPSDRLDDLHGSGESAEDLLAAGDRQQEVRRALSELKPEDREVLVLRYALDWSSQRMATALETTAAAIDMRLSRARRRLAARLEGSGASDD